jgi:hypothetical protein
VPEKFDLVSILLMWVGVAALVIADSRNQLRTKNKGLGNSNDGGSSNIRLAALIARFPRIKDPPDCPEQAKHWYQARRQADFTLYALAVSFVALIGGWLAFREARIQADAAVAANRPWLEITLAQKNDVHIMLSGALGPGRGRGVLFRTVWTIKNVGHLPATQVSYQTLILAGNFNLKNIQDSACDTPHRDGGPVIFPNVSTSSDDLLTGNRNGFTAIGISESQLANAGSIFIIPCVAYSGEAQGKRTFYTARVFRASFLGYRLGEKVFMYIPDLGADIPSDRWDLDPVPWIGDSVR